MKKPDKKCSICGCYDHNFIGCIKHISKKCTCYKK